MFINIINCYSFRIIVISILFFCLNPLIEVSQNSLLRLVWNSSLKIDVCQRQPSFMHIPTQYSSIFEKRLCVLSDFVNKVPLKRRVKLDHPWLSQSISHLMNSTQRIMKLQTILSLEKCINAI